MVAPVEPESAEDFIARKRCTWEAEREQDRPSLWTKDVGRRGRTGWKREAWTFQVQTNYRVKVIVLERIRAVVDDGERLYDLGPLGRVEYRLGYYTLGGFRAGLGHWRWGQFSLMIPAQDLTDLLDRARAEGTLLDPTEP